ncbi:type 1 glutamine amidotransferase [bacterium]|nr:type 1 glutamine amidotransferase [bacterium]
MDLKGKRVVILVERDFQDMEVMYPYYRFKEEGALVAAVGVEAKEYKGKNGYPIKAEKRTTEITAKDLDALVIPGGWAPDFLRRDPATIALVRAAFEAGKVVGAICHAGWVLCSARVLKGKRVTSFFAIKDDMTNAGAEWTDAEVVVDGNLITSRTPDDLPAFCRAILEKLGVRA